MKLDTKNSVAELSYEEIELVVGGSGHIESNQYPTQNIVLELYDISATNPPLIKKPKKKN